MAGWPGVVTALLLRALMDANRASRRLRAVQQTRYNGHGRSHLSPSHQYPNRGQHLSSTYLPCCSPRKRQTQRLYTKFIFWATMNGPNLLPMRCQAYTIPSKCLDGEAALPQNTETSRKSVLTTDGQLPTSKPTSLCLGPLPRAMIRGLTSSWYQAEVKKL